MPVSFSLSQRISIAPDVLHRQVGDEAVLLNLKTELYFGLDQVGARMWDVLNEAFSIQAAYETLLQEYDVPPGQLREDLDELLEGLVALGLVQLGEIGQGPSVDQPTE